MQSGEDESLHYFRQARLGTQTVPTVNSPENQLLTIELEGSGSVQLSLSDSLIEAGVPNKKSAKYTISSPVYVDPGSLGYVPFYSGSQLLDSSTSIFYDSGSYYVGIGSTAWTTTPPAYPLDIQYDTNISGSLSVTGSTLITGSLGVYGDSFISGNLGVDGTVTAKELHITYITSSVLYESGSTKFGNSFDDTHEITGSVMITGSLEVVGGLKATGSTNIYLNQDAFETFKVDSSFADYLTINSSNAESNREIVIGRAIGGGKDRYIKLTTNSFDFQNTPSSKISLSSTGITLFTNNRDQTFRIDDPNSPFVKYEWVTKSSGSEGFEPLMQIYADSNYKYALQPLKNASYEIKNSDTDSVYLSISSSSDAISISGSSVGLTGSVAVATHLTASGHVSASAYYGDASGLTNLPSSGITALVDDPSPQLGETLDVNGEAISGSLVQVTGSLQVSGSGTISGDILVGGSTNGNITLRRTTGLGIIGELSVDAGNTYLRNYQGSGTTFTVRDLSNIDQRVLTLKSYGSGVKVGAYLASRHEITGSLRIRVPDNTSEVWRVSEGANVYHKIDTTNGSERNNLSNGNGIFQILLGPTQTLIRPPNAEGHIDLINGGFTYSLHDASSFFRILGSNDTDQILRANDDGVQITGSTSISGPLQVHSDSFVSGNFAVDGTLTAKEFHTTFVTSSVLYESGSTKFGDSADDTHEFSGSVFIDGDTTVYGDVVAYDSFKIERSGLPPGAGPFSITKGHNTTIQSYGGDAKINLLGTSLDIGRSLVAGTEGGFNPNHQITGSLNLSGSLYLTGGYVIAPQATGLLAGNSQVTVATGSGISQVRLSSSAAEVVLEDDIVFKVSGSDTYGPTRLTVSNTLITAARRIKATAHIEANSINNLGNEWTWLQGGRDDVYLKSERANTNLQAQSGSIILSGSSGTQVTGSVQVYGTGSALAEARGSGSLSTEGHVRAGTYLSLHNYTDATYGELSFPNIYLTTGTTPDQLVVQSSASHDMSVEAGETLFVRGDNIDIRSSDGNIKLYLVDTVNDSIQLTGSTGISGDLDVSGDITCTSLTETSARDLKDNVRSMNNELYKVLKLRPVSYDWKETKESDKGFIAEELNEVYPELTSVDDDGKSTGVKYTKMTSVLTRALQELHHIVETQQKEINKLKDELTILRDKDDG